MADVEILWGHALKIWDTGRTIRVPQSLFPQLRQRGLLLNNKAVLSPRIVQDFNDGDLHAITHDIKKILGGDLGGPMQVICRCRECRERVNVDDARCSDFNTDQIVREVTSRRHLKEAQRGSCRSNRDGRARGRAALR